MKNIVFSLQNYIIQLNDPTKNGIYVKNVISILMQINTNEIPCQVVCNKMAVDPIPNKLRDLKKLEKVLILEFCLRK